MTFTPPASLGPFEFPPPYATRGIRLTNSSNAPQGCHPRIYPYWSVINNHRGQSYLYVIVGRVGLKPLLLTVSTINGAVLSQRELPMDGTGEGMYFSDTLPTSFYFLEGPQLWRHDVFDGRTATVFTLDPKHGNDLWQAHSSSDDQTHSATVRRRTSEGPYDVLGAVVFKDGKQQFIVKPGTGVFDECQIDKSGRWLVVQQGDENHIRDMERGGPIRTIRNAEGALSHIDCGDDYMVGENDQGQMWTMGRVDLASGAQEVIYRGHKGAAWGNGMGHVAVRGNVALLSANDGNELLTIDMARHGERQIAPGMIDGSDYDHQLRACLDPTGEYACWIALVDGRFDAFLVRLPDVSAPPIIVHPEPGVSMTPLPYFTSAEKAELAHDSGFTSVGVPGTFDGRDALIIPTVDTLPEGNGAWISLTWANGKGVRQHGRLYLKQEPDRATFAVDMTEEPTGF